MKLNKKLFLIFLILLILIIPQSICAADNLDLSDVNGADMVADDCNLKLNDNDPMDYYDIGSLNSINEIDDIKNGISSDRVDGDMALDSTKSSTLDDEGYFVSHKRLIFAVSFLILHYYSLRSCPMPIFSSVRRRSTISLNRSVRLSSTLIIGFQPMLIAFSGLPIKSGMSLLRS